jgi:hypothetical protein
MSGSSITFRRDEVVRTGFLGRIGATCDLVDGVKLIEMGLPNADKAEVDLRKLGAYFVCFQHPVDKHQAAVFRTALSLMVEDAPELRGFILQAAVDGEAFFKRADEYGERYRVDFEVHERNGEGENSFSVDHSSR